MKWSKTHREKQSAENRTPLSPPCAQYFHRKLIDSILALYSGMVLGFFGIQHFGQKKLKLNKIDWYVEMPIEAFPNPQTRVRYWYSSLDAQLDMFTAAATFIVVALLVRIRQLFQWPNKTRTATYRKHLLHQLLFSLIDWLVAPFYMLVLCTYWRYNELQMMGEKKGELAQRAETVYTALKVLLDIPIYVLIIPMSLTIWRAPALWRDVLAVS